MRIRILTSLLLLAAHSAAAVPMVSLSPSTLEVTSASTFQVSVMVNSDVSDLSCFAVSLVYDPLLVQLISASEGSLFSTSGNPTFFSLDVDSLDRDRASDCLLGFGTSVSGAGEIAVLTFQPLVNGVGSIDLVDVVVRDVNRAVIPGVIVQGSSLIVGATGVTPRAGRGALLLRAEPNPSAGAVSFRLLRGARDVATESSAGGELLVYDLSGRLVRRMNGGDAVRWDGRDSLGRPIASGIYFAILRLTDGREARTKFLRLD